MMRWITSIIFLLGLFVLDHEALRSQESGITRVGVQFSIPQAPSVQASVEKYLMRFLGKQATSKELIAAEDFFTHLFFVHRAKCEYLKDGLILTMNCYVVPHKIIKKINIINLPSYLLEKELRRKLPIQVGHLLDNENNDEEISIIKSRIQTYLKKNGYYGGIVEVREKTQANASDVTFDIEIKGGVQVRVNEVIVDGDSPISPQIIKKMYERMCLSFSHFFDGVTLGTMRCYSRNLERETTKDLQNHLAKMGYVRSYVRISHVWVDRTDASAMPFCRQKLGDEKLSSCVNLRIDIDKGPLVKWSINLKDNTSINAGPFTSFLASLFATEQIYRATASKSSQNFSTDSLINMQEVENRITFVAAHNIDEIEIRTSSEEIVKYLNSRGYINAQVVSSITQKGPEEININLDIYTGANYFLSSVRIEPAKYREFLSQDVLEKIVPKRSIMNSGHVAYKDFEAAALEIKNRLVAKGFLDPTVKTDLSTKLNGAIEATFYVTEGGDSVGRQTIDEIEIINGEEGINKEALLILQNCDNQSFTLEGSGAKACMGSSLLEDAIPSDVARLEDFYHNNGYLYAKIKADLEKKEGINRLIFHVYDDRFADEPARKPNRQKLKGLIISGNETTRSKVIERYFPPLNQETDLDQSGLKKGITNLRSSGRFSKIDHKIISGDHNSDDVYYSVQVAENQSLSLNVAFSFSTDQLFIAEAEIKELNFLRSMLTLDTSLGLGFFWGRQSYLSNKIVWPFMFGKPLRLSVDAPNIVYDDRTHLAKPQRRLQTKLGATIEWQVNPNFTPYLRYHLLHTQLSEGPSKEVSFGDRFRSLDGFIPTAQQIGDLRGIITPGFSYFKVDNQFNPRSGFLLDNWVELSGGQFMGKPSFTNIVTNNRFFVPIGPLVLAMRAKLIRSFIEFGEDNWKKLDSVSSMHSLGGDRSVRGYGNNIRPNFAAGPGGAMQGYLSNVASLELRFPLSRAEALSNLWGAAFVDHGMILRCTDLFRCDLKESFRNLGNSKNPALSIGLGVRYILPVGPISLDYAISPLDPTNMRVHVLFGYSF